MATSSENIDVTSNEGEPRQAHPPRADSCCTPLTVTFHSGDKPINLVSILNPNVSIGYASTDLDSYHQAWSSCSVPIHTDVPSYAEDQITKWLDLNYVSPVSDAFIVKMWASLISPAVHTPYRPSQSVLPFNGLRIKIACGCIAAIMRHTVETPELQRYVQLVKILSELPLHERTLVQKQLELKFGPIVALAATTSMRNIEWFLNKAQISNGIPLLHQVFSSPSLFGKLNAIWRLLELYGILWQPIDWVKVQAVVHTIYSIFAWLMEKCKLAAAFVQNKFTWVKATTVKQDNEIVTQASDEAVLNIAEQIMPTGVDNINDCVFHAVAPQANMTHTQLKTGFIEWLRTYDDAHIQTLFSLNGGNAEMDGISQESILQHIQSDEEKEDYVLLLLSEYLRTNIVMHYDRYILMADNITQRQSSRRTIYVRYIDNPRHFMAMPPRGGNTASKWLKEEYLHTPQCCHTCNAPATDSCAVCFEPVCQSHFSVCCTNRTTPVIENGIIVGQILSYLPSPEVNIPSSDSDSPSPLLTPDPPTPEEPAKEVLVVDLPVEKEVLVVDLPVSEDEQNEKNRIKEESMNTQPTIPEDPTWYTKIENWWDTVKSFFESMNVTEMSRKILDQMRGIFGDVYAWLKENPILVGLISLVTTIATMLGVAIPTITNPLDKRSLISRCTEATRSIYYAQRTSTSILESFKDFGTAVATVMGISTDAQIDDFKKRLVDINERASALLAVAGVDPGKFVNEGDKMIKFVKEMEAIDRIYRDLSRTSDKVNLQVLTPIWQQLNKTSTSLKQLYGKFGACMTQRQEPVVIWLYGETNLGKSQLIKWMIDQINAKTGRQLSTFTVSKGPDYWNGFIGQKIITIDDFGCWLGPEGNLDALHMFNLKTSAPYNANMPGMDEKCYMAAPFYVIVASNNPSVPLNTGVGDIKAFERRRDFFVKVTWPGHDRCVAPNCKHIQEVRDQQEQNGGVKKFDHLTLQLCPANVSTFQNVDEVTTIRIIKEHYQINGDKVTAHELVDKAIALEQALHKSFKTDFNATTKLLQSDVMKYSEYPMYAVVGPPGTGKSHIFNSLSCKTQRIVTIEEFNLFCKEFKPQPDCAMVVFDDLSTFVTSEYFYPFLREVKRRCDVVVDATTPWCMGINAGILNPHIAKAFGAEEADAEACADAQGFFYRRVNCFYSKFKRQPFKCLWKPYTAELVKQGIANGQTIENFVQYTWGEGDAMQKLSQQAVIKRIETVKVEVKEVSTIESLQYINPSKPDCSADLDLTTTEFLSIVNSSDIVAIIKLLKSEKVKINSGIMKREEIFPRICKSVMDAKSHLGYHFDTFDDFFLECSNQRFFANFEGIKCYIKFTDEAYSIEQGPSGYSIAYKINDPTMAVVEAQMALNGLSKSITTADFLAMSATNFSPWFCFVGDLLTMLLKISLTAVSVSKSISDQVRSTAAIRAFSEIHNNAHAYAETEISTMAGKFANKLFMTNDKRDVSAYHMVTNDNDPYGELRAETDPDKYRPKIDRHLDTTNWRAGMRETDEDTRRADYRKLVDKTNWRTGKALEKAKVKLAGLELPAIQTQLGLSPIYAEYADERLRKSGKVTLQTIVKHDDVQNLPQVPVLQTCSDPDLIPVAYNVMRNMVQLVSESGTHLCHGVVVHDLIGTTVWHILHAYPGLQGVYAIDIEQNRYKLRIVHEVLAIDRVDFEMIPIAGSVKFRDITKWIAPMNYRKFSGHDAILLTSTRDISKKFAVLVFRSFKVTDLTSAYCDKAQMKVNLIKYEGHRVGYSSTGMVTRNGDCGSLLLVSDVHNGGKILGMHSRADTNATGAYVRPMHREHYTNIQTQLSANILGGFMNEARPVVGDHPLVGEATWETFSPTKTRLFRNVAPIGEKMYEPSILSDFDRRNPGHNMLLKEGLRWVKPKKELCVEDRNLYRQCMRDLAEQTVNVLSRNNAILTVMTKRQALNKYRHAVHSEPIPIHKSAGYPWAKMAKDPGKHSYIVTDEDTGTRRFNTGEVVDKLHNAIDRYVGAANSEKSCEDPIFQIFLKDEPLKLKKIYDQINPQTRTIAAAPLHFQIVHRQFIHSAIASMMDNQNELFLAIGIDPTSAEWDLMWKKATTKGRYAAAMDYKGWDFGLLPFEIECLSDFWNYLFQTLDPRWNECDDNVRDKIYRDLAHARILIGKLIFEANGGMMSGSPGTTPDNSIINAVRKRFDWVKIMRKVNAALAGLDFYNKLIFEKYYGDDFFLVIPNSVIHVFNNKTIAAIEEEYFGAVMTHPSKEKELTEYENLAEVSFMSRNFKLIGDRMFGVLEWPRVCKPTWWVHDSRNHVFWADPNSVVKNYDHAFSAYESALMEALFHGHEKFKLIRDTAQKQFYKLGYHKVLPDFDTLWAEVQGMPPPPGHKEDIEFHVIDDLIKISGIKRPKVPKDARHFANRSAWSYGAAYSYKGAIHEETPIPPQWQRLLDLVNEKFGRRWNSVLCNHYPIGGQIPWHKDDEPELDINEGVGCVTLYGDGMLSVHREGEVMYERLMEPNLMYILGPNNLLHYKHRRSMHHASTLSITFRRLEA